MDPNDAENQEAQLLLVPPEATPLDVTVAGGHFGHAVIGTQIVNKSTVVHHHATSGDVSDLPPGHFRLSSHITVSELDPINRDSRIYRAKLHSKTLGDLEIVVKIQSDGERQRREARIHFSVPHHRNIVERILTDAFKYQGQSCIYIAMEQCDAQNLHAYVVSLVEENAPYDAKMFMSFAFQIATGLEFLHRHKILNRDLKPENILLSADKTIAKIADFGMSKEMTGEASTVSALQPGTDGWRSPEILKNDERITLANDIFSLGLIFHFLWSYGKHAFGDDPHAWNLYIKRGINMVLDWLKIPDINGAKALLKSMLNQEPGKRPSCLEVLRNAVFKDARLQSDAAAIYRNVDRTAEHTQDFTDNKATPLDVAIAGGHFGHAVFGTQIVNKTTVVHHHATSGDVPDLPPGHFRLSSHITVSELDPINRDSRMYRAKLHSKILGDLEIVVKIQSDGERQRREARIHFSVPHHRNIVERILTDTFKYQGQSCIYIAMEQCDALNLHAYVVSLVEENAPYYAEMFMSFAFQIATGLEFLHRHKILNRDLKPENILLSADKTTAKIADFGMSKEMIGEASTVSAFQPGSDGWRSPEILKNDERITLASDIFSLGLIFHFLWSYGKHAFGDDPHAWNLYIKRGINMVLDWLKIPDINGAKALLKSMFNQEPGKRPSCLEVLRNTVFESVRTQSDAAAIYRDVDRASNQTQELTDNEGGKSEIEVTEEDQASASIGELVTSTESNTELSRESVETFDIVDSFGFGNICRGRMNMKEVLVWECEQYCPQGFQNMFQALSNLVHPNIIKFYGQVSTTPYLVVTEFMPQNLIDYLKKNGKQITPDIFHMAAQVAAGMEYMTTKRYFHGDLRAASIMVDDDLNCKITNFTMTVEMGTEYENGWRFPMKWTAPELFLYPFKSTTKSDVWSFGILLTEMVSGGRVPYPGVKNKEVVEMVGRGYRMSKLAKCPVALYENVMLPCWEEDPDKRPTFHWLKKTMEDLFATGKIEGVAIVLSVPSLESSEKNDSTSSMIKHSDYKSLKILKIELSESLKQHEVVVKELVDDLTFIKVFEGKFKNQKVAVSKYSDDEDTEKFDRSVDALKGLDHENIIKFLMEIPELCVIVTEFYDATLHDFLMFGEGKQMELNKLTSMAAQIASGMAYLHRMKYIHCDLRAENIVIVPDSRCKISGFSLSHYVGGRGYFREKINWSIKWTAPEVLSDETVIASYKIDVWSFGVVLWEIVSKGKEPYQEYGGDFYVQSGVSRGHRLVKPEGCPNGLYYDVMRSCWDENPVARPSFDSLKEILKAYRADDEKQDEDESVTMQALFDYDADEEGELNMTKGDVIKDCDWTV